LSERKNLIALTLVFCIVLASNVATILIVYSLTSRVMKVYVQLEQQPQEVHVTVTLPTIVSQILQDKEISFRTIKYCKLSHVSIIFCDIENCYILSCRITNSTLKDCSVINTVFIGCQLENVSAKNCTWENS